MGRRSLTLILTFFEKEKEKMALLKYGHFAFKFGNGLLKFESSFWMLNLFQKIALQSLIIVLHNNSSHDFICHNPYPNLGDLK